jgi:hypothetical protein
MHTVDQAVMNAIDGRLTKMLESTDGTDKGLVDTGAGKEEIDMETVHRISVQDERTAMNLSGK